MKLLFTVLLFVISCTIGFAQGGIAHPATPRLMVDADGNLVSKTHPLPVDAEVTIGSITMETTIVPVTEWETQTITLVAETAQTITSGIAGNRRFINLQSHVPGKIFWLAFDAAAVISQGTMVNDSIYLEAPKDVDISVIASEAFSISVTEGGY